MRGNPIDEEIIKYLKEDSRESYIEIGKKLNLSDGAIRRRIKNLIDGGVIKRFTIEIGNEGTTSAIVLVSVDSSIDTSQVSLKLAEIEGVNTVYEITGQYDIATIISATNIAEINTSIDALRKIEGVIDTNTVIILRKVL